MEFIYVFRKNGWNSVGVFLTDSKMVLVELDEETGRAFGIEVLDKNIDLRSYIDSTEELFVSLPSVGFHLDEKEYNKFSEAINEQINSG